MVKESQQRADPEAGSSGRGVITARSAECGACDIHVSPRNIFLHEVLEKDRADDRAGTAAERDIPERRDGALDV